MAKEKKYVKVQSEETENNEVYGKDRHGKIIKIEQTGDPHKRATTKRIWAIVCWVIAIAFEVIGILKLTNVIDWFSELELSTFLIICIVLDLIFVIIGSLLWKKANHIDPASEKNKTKFWLWNNL
jgi:Na+/proline symporter